MSNYDIESGFIKKYKTIINIIKYLDKYYVSESFINDIKYNTNFTIFNNLNTTDLIKLTLKVNNIIDSYVCISYIYGGFIYDLNWLEINNETIMINTNYNDNFDINIICYEDNDEILIKEINELEEINNHQYVQIQHLNYQLEKLEKRLFDLEKINNIKYDYLHIKLKNKKLNEEFKRIFKLFRKINL